MKVSLFKYFGYILLIINIIKHDALKHRIVTQEEKERLISKYDIQNYNQLPIILKIDPVANFF